VSQGDKEQLQAHIIDAIHVDDAALLGQAQGEPKEDKPVAAQKDVFPPPAPRASISLLLWQRRKNILLCCHRLVLLRFALCLPNKGRIIDMDRVDDVRLELLLISLRHAYSAFS